MIWSDNGYLLSKNKYGENSVIAEFFTENHGKVSGIIYGATSKKIRNYLQIGNKFHINYNSKNENKLGYFKTELIKPITPLFFNDRERTSALISLCSMLNILLPEAQPNKNIYEAFEGFIKSISLKNWIILYIFFELNLIKFLGYDTNLNNFNDDSSEIEFRKIKIDTYTYEVPVYLISKKIPKNLSNNLIKKSLYFTRNIIQNRFFIPNNLPFPKTRILLEKYYD